MQNVLARARRDISTIAGIEIILSALFSLVLGTYLTRQLASLKAASQSIAAGELGHQVPMHGRDEIAQTARAAGMQGCLTKPIRQAQLHDCLTMALGFTPPTTLVTTQGLAQVSHHSHKHILLVEDDVVNQQVAQGMLHKLGYRADVVSNGLEAVAALAQRSYDLILMDCRMPEIDGYQATRLIREREQAQDAARVPIITMTAHAMPGDCDACQHAGMDDYLSKPVTTKGLHEMLTRWLPPDGSEEAVSSVSYTARSDSQMPDDPVNPLDSVVVHELRDTLGKRFFVALEAFRHSTVTRLATLHKAAAQGDEDIMVHRPRPAGQQ